MRDFKENELIIYQNGDKFEIGKIKRLTEDGAFVYYHSGDTASKTPFDCMHKLVNNYCIIKTTLGGGNGNSRLDELLTVKQLGDKIGYGNIMDIASALWAKLLLDEYGIEGGCHLPTVEPYMTEEGKKVARSGLVARLQELEAYNISFKKAGEQNE